MRERDRERDGERCRREDEMASQKNTHTPCKHTQGTHTLKQKKGTMAPLKQS